VAGVAAVVGFEGVEEHGLGELAAVEAGLVAAVDRHRLGALFQHGFDVHVPRRREHGR
jgi:hypothetical protein